MRKKLIADGEIKFITEDMEGDSRTMLIEGGLDGGKLEIFARGEVVEVPVADGGAFNDLNVDAFGKPIRRIVITGRQKALVLKLSGSAGNATLRVEVF